MVGHGVREAEALGDAEGTFLHRHGFREEAPVSRLDRSSASTLLGVGDELLENDGIAVKLGSGDGAIFLDLSV